MTGTLVNGYFKRRWLKNEIFIVYIVDICNWRLIARCERNKKSMTLVFWVCVPLLVAILETQVMTYDHDKGDTGHATKQHCPDLRSGKRMSDISIEPFEIFKTKLPSDLFVGSNQYTLELLELDPIKNHCWFKFEPVTRELTMIADENVLKYQRHSSHGFKFQLKATSTCNQQTASSMFYVRIASQVQRNTCLTVDFELLSKTTVHSCLVGAMVDITKRIEHYIDKGTDVVLIYDFQYNTQIKHDNGDVFKFTVAFKDDVTHCKDRCDQTHLQHMASKFISEFGAINKAFVHELGSEYTIHSIYTNPICPSASKLPYESSKSSCQEPQVYHGMQDLTVPAYKLTKIQITDDVFKEKNLEFSLTVVGGTTNKECWFRVVDSVIHFYPTQQHTLQSKSPFAFTLTARNTCGESDTRVHFYVTIEKPPRQRLPCFLLDAVFQSTTHDDTRCRIKVIEQFHHFLTRNLPQEIFGDFQIISRKSKPNMLILTFTLWKSEACSYCGGTYLGNVKNRLLTNDDLYNNKNKRFVVGDFTLQNIHVSSPCICEEQNSIVEAGMFTAIPGIINKFTIVNKGRTESKGTNSKILSFPDRITKKDQVCLLTVSGIPQLWYFSSVSSSAGHDNTNSERIVDLTPTKASECGTVNSIRLTMGTVPHHTCYSITIRYTDVMSQSTCLVQSLDSVITEIAKRFEVHRRQIIVLEYMLKEPRAKKHHFVKEIVLKLAFSNSCGKACGHAVIKDHSTRFVLQHKDLTKSRHSTPVLIFQNITFNECQFDAGAFGLLHTSSSYVPLWVYMLPALLGLLLLFIFFITCCCRGAKKNCCYFCCAKNCGCCCGIGSSGRRDRKVHHVKNYVTTANCDSQESITGTTGGAVRYTNATSKSSASNVQSIPILVCNGSSNASSETSLNNISSGITDTASVTAQGTGIVTVIDKKVGTSNLAPDTHEVAVACGSTNTGTHNGDDDVNSDPVVKRCTTTTTRETIYSRKYFTNPAFSTLPNRRVTVEEVFNENEPNNTTKTTTKTTTTTLRDDNSMQNTRRRINSSRRIRSYSDGFLLEDGLNLPTPPACDDDILAENRARLQALREYRHRGARSSRKYSDETSYDTRQKIVIPVKLTGRVKNISKSHDDILCTSRSRYAKFNDAGQDFEPLVLTRKKTQDRDMAKEIPLRMPSFRKTSSPSSRNDHHFRVESWSDGRHFTNNGVTRSSKEEIMSDKSHQEEVSAKKRRSVRVKRSSGRVVFPSAKHYVKIDHNTSEV